MTLSEVATIRNTKSNGNVASQLSVVVESLDDDQGEDVRIVPLAGKADFSDYMVIASGQSARKVGAMAEHIMGRLKRVGFRGAHAEGLAQCNWVLIDAGDIVVHLFQPGVRAYYDLEKLWEADVTPDEPAQRAGMT